jgi:hypothetical protein
VVFADPRLVEPDAIEVLDELEVTFQGQRRVVARRMERRHEDAEPQSLAHSMPPFGSSPRRTGKMSPSPEDSWKTDI